MSLLHEVIFFFPVKIMQNLKVKELVAIVLGWTVLSVSLPVFPQTKQDGKGVGNKPVTQLPARDKRWALIIGVDDYKDENIGDMRGAANDAEKLAESLSKYAGFPEDQIILLTTNAPTQRQPTRANILQRLSNLRSLVPKDGLLLVSFSGHGIERGGRAFLIPSDAISTEDVELLEDTAIAVENMKRQMKNTQVQQVLFLIDACRNDPTSGRSDSTNPLTEAYKRGFSFDVRNKKVEAFATIYATSVGARAYEYAEKKQGYFSWAIIEALSGKAANAEGEITLGGLVKYIEQRVPKLVAIDLGGGKLQRPFAVIEGYKADELVLAIGSNPNPVPSPRPSPTPKDDDGKSGEDLLWEEATRRNTKTAYQSYLGEYPGGKYAATARLKIKNIEEDERKAEETRRLEEANRLKQAEWTKWAEAERQNTIESYRSYLSAYPSGEYKAIANLRINDLTAKAEAEKLRNPKKGLSIKTQIGNGVEMEFMGIPAGTFRMGSPTNETGRFDDEKQHLVSASVKEWQLRLLTEIL
jgi:hypothetical protein